jgi:hypothetical protein
VERTGLQYLPFIGLYIAVLLGVYAMGERLFPQGSVGVKWPPLSAVLFIKLVLALQLVLMAVHWARLGEIPLWTALHTSNDLAIVSIRREAGEDLPLLLRYGSHFMIKALVPFALLLAWGHHRKLFWGLAIVAAVYAASLLAKSFVITLFVPLWIAFLLRRRWLSFAVLSVAFLLMTIVLSTVANPQKLATEPATGAAIAQPVDEGVKEHGFLGDAVLGIGRRILLMPGWTVAEWFGHIPKDIPFVEGAAVRPLAAVLGKPYVDLSERVYALAYPEMAAKGVPGTMGTASFMYGYANYGAWGLAGAGAITALMLLLVQRIFGHRWQWALALNVFPLLALSGTALPTVMVTHGWLLTILLFLWVQPREVPAA